MQMAIDVRANRTEASFGCFCGDRVRLHQSTDCDGGAAAAACFAMQVDGLLRRRGFVD